MSALRVAAILAALLLLAVPPASAAEAEGVLLVEGNATFSGPTGMSADSVSLAFDALPDLVVNADAFVVERWIRTQTLAPGDLPLVGAEGEDRREVQEHGAGTLTLGDAGADLRVSLDAQRFDGASATGGALAPVLGVRLYSTHEALDENACNPTFPCSARYATHEMTFDALDAQLSGDVVLYLYDATLTLSDESGETTYAAGETPASNGVQNEIVHLVVRMSGTDATLRTTTAARAYADAPLLDVVEATFADATGALEIGARAYRAANHGLETAGTLVLEPRPIAERADYGADGAPTFATTFETAVRGDVSRINLAAIPIYQGAPAEAAGLLALTAAALGAIAYFWPSVQFQATALVAPLYSRLQPPKLLDNDVRNGIYQIIRDNPGISARSVHRKSDQSWGTVVYHLRQLEAHHLIVSRRFGRSRNFYENHGKYKGMERQLAVLRSPRARVIARCILDNPTLTQEALANAADLAQPTTSYYVRKLVQVELVAEARDGRYVHYQPTPELARYLSVSEQAHDPAADAEPPASAKA